MLRVEDGEHPLVELGEELLERLLQVHLALLVILLQVLEEVDENVGVPLVDDPVSFLEQLVELQLGGREQIREEFWNEKMSPRE